MGAYLSRPVVPVVIPTVDAESDVEITCECCSTTVAREDMETHQK